MSFNDIPDANIALAFFSCHFHNALTRSPAIELRELF
jgi:hypothetical protein